MAEMTSYTLRDMLEQSAGTYKELPAVGLADESLVYSFTALLASVKEAANSLHAQGVVPGDRIAILGENSPNWGIIYFAITCMGAVAVPILPDFSRKEVSTILDHAGVRGLAVTRRLFEKSADYVRSYPETLLVRLDDLTPVQQPVNTSEFGKAPTLPMTDTGSVSRMVEGEFLDPRPKEEDLACLIYTSGTTGQSKGVMLTHRNITWDAAACVDAFIDLHPGERSVSVLPLSHAYECTIGFILLLMAGVGIYYLGKPPATSVLLPALKRIKPHIMLSVPLLIEKIYRTSVLNKIKKHKGLAWTYQHIGLIRRIVNRAVGKTLMDTFGGRLRFFGLGGAPLDPEVERFLREAKFPYAIGYGLTETAPMVAGSGPSTTKITSIGQIVKGVDVRIADVEPGLTHGEIQVRGPNVMVGYYHNPEATHEAFTDDGWFCTGDLGYIDGTGRLYIKGRKKSMILGPSGENIFPESIEAVINGFDFVEESLVIPIDGGLGAMIKIDIDAFAENLKLSIDQAQEAANSYLHTLRTRVNKELNAFSRITTVALQKDSFIRTPTKKIKRYLYRQFNIEVKDDQQSEENREEHT